MIELPVGWNRVPLGELVKAVRPRVHPREADGLPFIGMDHVESHTMRLLRTVPASTMKSAGVRFEPGDVLYGRLRPYLNKVYRPDFPGLGSAEFIALTPSEELDGDYLRYLLSSADFVRFATGLNTGDRPRVDFKQIADYMVPLPEPREQRRIVGVIEAQLSRLSVATESARAAAAKLGQYRDLSLQLAVTGQRHRLSPRFADGTHPVPERWRWTRLGEIAEIVGGVTKDAKKESRPGLVEVPYLRVANVQRGYLDLANVKTVRVTPEEVAALRLRAGDVLFNEGGDRDKLGRGWIWSGEIDPCIHQNHVFRARLRVTDIDPRFVSWYANAMGQAFFFSHGRQTTNLASISKTQLAKFPVPIPPPDEQEFIVKEIERRLSVIDELRREVGIALRRASALSRAVLGAAFAGRLEGSAA